MFNYLNSLFIKKIFFLLFLNLTLSSIKTKFTQYNNISNNISKVCINDEDLAERNKKALEFIENCAVNNNYRKDNIVGISIYDESTKKDIGYILCSSIINGKIYEEASREVIRKKRKIDTKKDFIKYEHLNPISMLDLLYMNVDDSLDQKIANSRVNKNRKIIEKVIKGSINAWKKASEQKTLQQKHDQMVTDICKSIDEIVITEINEKDEKMQAVKVELSELATAVIDFIKRLEQYSDGIPHHPLIDKDTTDNILNSLLRKDFNDKTTLSNIIIYIHRMISSPWSQDSKDESCVAFLGLQAYPVPRFSVITHTEQMIDWLSFKLGYDIQVIISGKAPCLKCSRYIRDATNKTVLDKWNNRTVIGFHTGWNNTKQLKEYLYSMKVFNAIPVNTDGENWTYQTGEPGTWLRQFESLKDNKGTYSLSTPERELMWRNKNGYYGSNVYAIENYESYSEQLMMKPDGSVCEKEPKCEIPRNPLGRVNRTTYPILLPAAQNSTTGLNDQIDINTQQNPALAMIPPQVRYLSDRQKRKAKNETPEESFSKKLKTNPPEKESKSDNPDDQKTLPSLK